MSEQNESNLDLTKLGPMADPVKADRSRKEKDLIAAQRVVDAKAVMSTPSGRRFIWALLEDLGWGVVRFHGEDTHRTALWIGNMKAAHELMGYLREHCLDLVRVMEDEAINERKRNRSR